MGDFGSWPNSYLILHSRALCHNGEGFGKTEIAMLPAQIGSFLHVTIAGNSVGLGRWELCRGGEVGEFRESLPGFAAIQTGQAGIRSDSGKIYMDCDETCMDCDAIHSVSDAICMDRDADCLDCAASYIDCATNCLDLGAFRIGRTAIHSSHGVSCQPRGSRNRALQQQQRRELSGLQRGRPTDAAGFATGAG